MWSEPELKYGRFLLQNRNPVLREYLQREILIREQILAGLDGKENRRIEQRRTELKKNWKKHRKGWIIMQCKEIMQVIEATYPRTAALDFDNVGLLAGRADKEVNRVYLALDATDRVIERAIEAGADMLITHHPLLFQP